jgi:proteasome accessory factor A
VAPRRRACNLDLWVHAAGGLGHGVLLRNGGRLDLDRVSRPEYATPGCDSVPELIVRDKAGERILEGLLADASQRLREEGVAAAGRHPDRVPGHQTAHLRRRHDGAGEERCVYCLSQPTRRTGSLRSPAADRPRAFLSTRHEPRAAAAGLRRLRVSVSDQSMSETTTLLKVGATKLVLRRAAVAGAAPELVLAKPVQAMDEVSSNLTGRSLLRPSSAGARAPGTTITTTGGGSTMLTSAERRFLRRATRLRRQGARPHPRSSGRLACF